MNLGFGVDDFLVVCDPVKEVRDRFVRALLLSRDGFTADIVDI